MVYNHKLLIQQPPSKESGTTETETTSIKPGCFTAGAPKVTTQLERFAYGPGEKVKTVVTVDNSKSSVDATAVSTWVSQDFRIMLEPAGPTESYLSDNTKIRKSTWKQLKVEHMRSDYEKSSRFIAYTNEEKRLARHLRLAQQTQGNMDVLDPRADIFEEEFTSYKAVTVPKVKSLTTVKAKKVSKLSCEAAFTS